MARNRNGKTYAFTAGGGESFVTGFDPDQDIIMLAGVDAGGYEVAFNSVSGNTTITYAGEAIVLEGVELAEIPDGMITHYGVGTERDDILHGGVGNDYLAGAGGDDLLSGGENADELHGGAGDDTLYGGRGDDTMRGGSGRDVFYFSGKDGHDTIADFSGGDDLIRFGPAVSPGTLSVTVNESGQLVLVFPGGSVTLASLTAHDMGWSESVTSEQMAECLLELGWLQFD